MVARINTPSHISRALNYNEQKVKQGHATLLYAAGYLKDAALLNYHEKMERFARLIELNNCKTNSLHISLNFDNTDQLDKKKLIAIANDYMEKIGFGQQPYLVYQHNDAGHPHIHLVTTPIRENGKRINTHNIGRNQSEQARKEIEIIYGLVKADGRRQSEISRLEPVKARAVQYGKSATRQAIANVLGKVLDAYRYTSLPELNAVLRQYNIAADRGEEGSRTYKHGGLVYRVLDEHGNKIGVPIKASELFEKPILKRLEEKFPENEKARLPFKAKLKVAIEMTLQGMLHPSLPKFVERLAAQGINAVLRKNNDGIVYGVTYIDNVEKTVFNGSDLGKQYSAKAVLERCGITAAPERQQGQQTVEQPALPSPSQGGTSQAGSNADKTHAATDNPLLGVLLQPGGQQDYVGPDDEKKKKKKQSRRI